MVRHWSIKSSVSYDKHTHKHIITAAGAAEIAGGMPILSIPFLDGSLEYIPIRSVSTKFYKHKRTCSK
jgi:hypothetical protein